MMMMMMIPILILIIMMMIFLQYKLRLAKNVSFKVIK